MRTEPTNPVPVLNLDVVDSDHACLTNILRGRDFQLTTSSDVAGALEILRRQRIPIVLCESDRRLGAWQDTLEKVMSLPDPPYLIVTSRLADDRLWAEALNLGAYDVLAKPFEEHEVKRIVNSAWLRWTDRIPNPAVNALTA